MIKNDKGVYKSPMETKESKKEMSLLKEKSIVATTILTTVIIVLFAIAYFMVSVLIKNRSIARMEEGFNAATAEITNKLEQESQILNTTADILSSADSLDPSSIQDTLDAILPLLATLNIRIILPDDTIIEPTGSVSDGSGRLSFEELAPLGEHISNRSASLTNGTPIFRHFVPIIKDGETVAILYGSTALSNLPHMLNVDYIYNAKASVYLIDMKDGTLLMDTYHDELAEDIYSFDIKEVRGGESWEDEIEKLKSGQSGYFEYYAEDAGEWMYFYYAPTTINQWAAAISVSKNEALTNQYAIQRILLFIAALILLSLTLYYMWTRKNTLETMERTVQQVVLEEKLKKAEAAERAKTMFLSNMSHDIRTPMNAIIGFTTLAQTNIDNKERVREYLDKILSSGNHLLSLINDVLDMSRIESGKLNIEEKECSISEIFKDMRNIIQTQMHSKQLNFFMDTIDVNDEYIYCDKLHINQVLLNLLGNAIKFTPAGGSVSLIIKQNPEAPNGYGSYEIRVKDTGMGMSEEFAKHVFEPFERERNSTVSGIQGTGLGMAISKSIIDAMGGTIRVETAPEKGTEFIINLDFRLQEDSKHVEIIQELEGMRALVVDDNYNTCDSVTKMLTQIGMRAQWTLHGKEAVLHAKQAVEMEDAFFAYIVDWALPDLGGIEVARQIRSIAGEDVPIIVLTAYDWSDIEKEAREAGVTAFCSKPLFISELSHTLAASIHKEAQTDPKSPITDISKLALGKRLLLVEDNELNREIAQELLQENGFEIETAEDGTIAVEKVKEASPGYYDLILMDVQMPIMNGYEATKAIRKLEDPALNSIPIVAMTANAFEDDKKQAMESGMNAHVAKPIDFNKLMEVLEEFLAK